MKRQRGFTLIEAVVATAVFAIVISSILGVYISTIQLDRKTRAQRGVADNARFIMEYLSKEVDNGTINYASYPGGLVSNNTDLYLENQANIIEHVYLNGTNMILNKGGSVVNLNSTAVKVTRLKFYIQPIGDPYTLAKTYNVQPHVTVIMELTSNYGTNPDSTVVMDLENTFAIQSYISRAVVASSPTVENVVFTNAVGVSVSGNNLANISSGGWGTSGASSVQTFTGDGYIQFSTNENNLGKMGGLSHTDTDQNYTSINYALQCNAAGLVYIYENGVAMASAVSPCVAGDVFRVAVESGIVKYYQNGILLYTSLKAPTYPLLFDSALNQIGGTITNVQMSP